MRSRELKAAITLNCYRDFESAAAAWDALVRAMPEPTVFDTLTWQKTWWSHFGPGEGLRLYTVANGPGGAAFIAPMTLTGDTVSFLGGTDLVDYHDFLAADGVAEAGIGALLAAVGPDLGCRRVELLSVPEGSNAATCFQPCAAAAGWTVSVEREDVAPRFTVPATWEAYLDGLDKKDRHELRRKMRRIEGAGELRDAELRDPGQIAESFDDFLTLHRKSTPEKAGFMTAEREKFFRDAAKALAADGVTRLRFLTLDGKPVATSLSFVVKGVRYLYNSGYDPEYRELAVGLMNHAFTIRASIAEGLRVFDFMRGSEPYKYHLGATDRNIYRITATR
jgi:CelD/BcsL family acetyltransferase involved in cellulose biosynthesis